MLSAAEEELRLAGVPTGLIARPLREFRRGTDGELVEVRTRRRQRKTKRVELVPESSQLPTAVEPSEERWLLSASHRRWTSISARYGEQAWGRAVELAAAGVVRLRCAIDEKLALGEPEGWVLTDEWEAQRVAHRRQRELAQGEVADLASIAASAVAERWPELAEALRDAAPGSPRTLVLLYAAQDLAEGVRHAGPRAFSQAHFDHTKARDDVGRILLDAELPEDLLVELGVRRSSRIGVAGPVTVWLGEHRIPLDALNGPVLLRADQPGLELHLTRRVTLVVVENLQAAEAVADEVPGAAVIYTAGVPGEPALRLLAALGAEAGRALLIPDADLGGVRIAEAVLRVLPLALLIDIGAEPHPPRKHWPTDGASVRGLDAAVKGRAGALAEACLRRGYPVEQELATIEAVRRQGGPRGHESVGL